MHFANSGEVTWRGFAQAIFAEALGGQAPQVGATTTAEYVTPAQRPLRATMDLVIGLTACSAPASNGGSFKPIHYVIE